MNIPIPANATEVIVTFSAGEPVPNEKPIVNAGANISIVLPTNSVQLKGSATDPDGTITAYIWEGPGVIANPNAATTNVTGLTQGSHVFKLTAIDNSGASVSDDMVVMVTAAPPPPPPAGYTLVFFNGFNTMTDLTKDNGQYGNGTISTSQKTEGAGSFYSRPENVSSGIRSEWQSNGNTQNPDEGAVEWDMMFEKIIPNNGHCFQFHPNTGGGSASPGLWFQDGVLDWKNWKGGTNTNHNTGIKPVLNKWYKMRIEFKFGSNGYFRFYVDGVLNNGGSWTGQVGDNSGHYMKVGYNGWDGNSASSRIYYDRVSVYKKS